MFRWLDNAWHSAIGAVDRTTANWVHAIVRGLYSFLYTIFGDVGGAWDDLLKDGSDFIGESVQIGEETSTKLADLYGWINKFGSYLFQWIRHPSLLVDFIWDDVIDKLETTAWDTAEKLGKFFIALIVKNLPKLLTLIEDVIEAVF